MSTDEPFKCEICHEDVAKHQYFDPDKRELYICEKCFQERSKQKPVKKVEEKEGECPISFDFTPCDPDKEEEPDGGLDEEEEEALSALIDFVLRRSCEDVLSLCRKSKKFKSGFRLKHHLQEVDIVIEVKVSDKSMDFIMKSIPEDQFKHRWKFDLTDVSVKFSGTTRIRKDKAKYNKETITPSQLMFILWTIDSVCRDKKSMEAL